MRTTGWMFKMRFFLIAFVFSQISPASSFNCPPGTSKNTLNYLNSCDQCAPGFFKPSKLTGSNTANSCSVHAKCLPGKYISLSGSAIAQPKCQSCAPGFFKGSMSKKSITCVEEPIVFGRCRSMPRMCSAQEHMHDFK